MCAIEIPKIEVDENLPILKKDKLSTGIREFDIILEGGYQNPGIVLLKGPPGMEKTAFAFHFAVAKKDEFVVFVAADANPETIKEKASSIGIDLSGEKIHFIDCYSSTVNKPSSEVSEGTREEAKKYLSIPGTTALNDLSLAINEMIKQAAGKKIRFIFYSLSAFLLYNSKDSILKFLQVINGRLKNASATVLFLVEDGVHEKAFLGSVERLMDERFSIELNKEGRLDLEIAEFGVTTQIKLGPNGIVIP